MINAKPMTSFIAFAAALICFLYAFPGQGHVASGTDSDAPVAFPKGYRKWVHVKSTVVTPHNAFFAKPPCVKPCVGGIFHFYANEKAMEGYRTGKFPDGAIIADDLHELKEAPAGDDTMPEGALRVVGVMVKDSQLYKATGGWGFESFRPGNESTGALTASDKAACFACHVSRKDSDFVFTEFHE